MSDTLNYSVPASGQPVSTDEITIDGVPQHLQRIKIGLGVNNAYQGDLSFGDAPIASSVPVTISSEQYVKQLMARADMTEVVESGTGLNAVIVSTNTTYYRHVSIQLTNTFSATVTFEGSNNNSVWYPVVLANAIGGQTTTASSLGVYYGPINTKYFRVRISSYTSGTVTATAEFSAMPNEMALPASASTFPTGTTSPAPTGITSGVYTRSVGPTFNNLGKRATYYASSNGLTTISVTPNAVTSLAYLWGSGNTNISLQKVLVTYAGGADGIFSVRLTKITAQHGSGAGVSAQGVTPQDVNDVGATASFYSAPTNAPTRHSTDLVTTVFGCNTDGQVDLMDILEGKGFIIPSGQPLGWEVRAIAGSGTGKDITTSPSFATTFIWTEGN